MKNLILGPIREILKPAACKLITLLRSGRSGRSKTKKLFLNLLANQRPNFNHTHEMYWSRELLRTGPDSNLVANCEQTASGYPASLANPSPASFASARVNIGESFSDSGLSSRIPTFAAYPLNAISMS